MISIRILYLIVIFLILLTDDIFVQMGILVDKYILMLGVPASILFFSSYSSLMKKWYYLTWVYLIICMLESYYYYYTPLKYVHVFAKIMVIFLVFVVYGFYKRFNKTSLAEVVGLILVSITINAIAVNSGSFSITAFVNNDRGIPSSGAFMLVLPFLFFFNSYFKTNKFSYFIGCVISFGLIMFLQHRTAWVALAIAGFVNFLLLRRTNFHISFQALIPIGFFVVMISIFIGTVLFSNEKILTRIQVSVEQLMNPAGNDKDDKASTSEWRYLQFQSYWPYVEENPVLGMRLKGFELPSQFYDHTGNLPFEDGTGHHFHSFYLDRLFYEGVVGLLLVTFIPFMYIYYCIKTYKYMTLEQITMVSFILSALFFGLSYDWPIFVYGMMGYTIYVLDKKESDSDKEVEWS